MFITFEIDLILFVFLLTWSKLMIDKSALRVRYKGMYQVECNCRNLSSKASNGNEMLIISSEKQTINDKYMICCPFPYRK